jgi:hypothetical protein
MKATLTKIDPLKASISNNGTFRRIYFELEDGSWAHTDVVPEFRNYKRWKPIIEKGVGTELTGIRVKFGSKVDADSPIKIL